MENKIKILFPVGSLYPDESGGVSISLYWLLRGLNKSTKVEVTSITTNTGISDNKVPINQWITTDYGRVIYLSVFKHKLAFKLILTFLKEVKNYDIIHLSSIFYPPSIICFFISLFFKKKIIWSIHGSLDDVEFKKRGLAKLAVLNILNIFIKNTTLHITSEQEYLFAKKRFSNAYKFVNVTNFMVLSNKLNHTKDNYFLYIGRFHYKKGIENLILGLKMSTLFFNSNFKLKLAGDHDNKYGKSIIKLVEECGLSDKIQFLGHVQGEEKTLLISKAYCMILPSFSENFGIVVVESLTQSTPVISSIYTPWHLLNEYKAGYWIDNKPEDICKSVNQILSLNSNDFSVMCENSYKLVDNEFNIFNKLQVWEQIYLSL